MNLFGTKTNPFDTVTKISVFPKIRSIVLKKDKKLIVFSPSYLLGKHGNTSQEVASKFMNLKTATQLLELIDNYVSNGKLTGQRVEIKEMNFGLDLGTDSLVQISEDLVGVLPVENIRGNNINTIYTQKERMPHTKLLNMVLVPFNPQYGEGVDLLFKEKYPGISFEQFEAVYAILTIFPGRFAPPFNDSSFWNQHALLKEMK
jgi:hypothetical protein